ncbi:hypothetical protein [Streptomyces sp. NTH33]|nr:hypothetical protein [Streptomyces sp. NTH33]
MKAAVVWGFGEPLVVEERPDADEAVDEVLGGKAGARTVFDLGTGG